MAQAVSKREKRLTLLACILGSSIVFLDGTVVNVALPAIQDDLDAGLAGQQWVVEAYLLTLASLLLIGGSLGDLLGRRRVFSAGVAGFGATSILCALAPNDEFLIGARALQGAAGALLVPSTLAIIVATFEESERGKAIGSWTAWGGMATVIGPFGGGVLIDAASWRWIFALNVVPIAVTLYLIARGMPARLDEREHRHIDYPGAVLCALGLAGPVFALIEQPTHGWSDPLVYVPLALGGVFLGLFLVQERRSRAPMMPLDLFRRRNFAIGNLATLTIYAGLGGALFFLVLFLQQVAGYSALEAGLSLTPLTLAMFTLSRRFGALADRLGPRAFMGGGPIVAGLGLLWFMRMEEHVSYWVDVLPGAVLFGLGLAATVSPLTATVLADADEHNAGVASGVNNAVARVAGLVAIAAVGAVISAQFASSLDDAVAGRSLAASDQRVVEEAKRRPLQSGAEGATPAVAAARTDAAVEGFRFGTLITGLLVIGGGVISALGIQNPRREVKAGECPGGAICGASRDLARDAGGRAATPEPAGSRA
jgi:EmrB/QacA subfamily drug resistance transporter